MKEPIPDHAALMPNEAPVPMPAQDFATVFQDKSAPGVPSDPHVIVWRLAAIVPAFVATTALIAVLHGWFADQGLGAVEAVLLALIAFNFFWICLTVTTVLLGILSLARQPNTVSDGAPSVDGAGAGPLNVALLVPVCDEVPWYVLGNARSMLEDLRDRGGGHEYAMYVLSDTRDDALAKTELESIRALRGLLSPGLRLHYRRRAQNTERKVGNITDWVRRWGGHHDAMLVLDADSLMSGPAIAGLADALSRDPTAGLIQSFPHLIGARSVFARMQQFANGVYGAALAEGLARWSGRDGNYWGHNAIMRIAAFANCAGLPPLRGRKGRESLIMSHDFVEAGLLRRAGWSVRFLPRIPGSYEETPHTLIDHIRRDRRWCQGNLQHLAILGARGFHPMTRFHLLHGAVGYLLSPIWFALLVMWALIGRGHEANVLSYFSEANPNMPTWPELTEARHVLIIILMYAMLLAPKFLGAVSLPLTGARFAEYGSAWRFAGSVLTETLLSVVYAPILMVQQMIAVLRTWLGLQKGWAPQQRDGGTYGLGQIMRCHILETVSGAMLLAGILSGLVSPWLVPIALSLAFAVPLSALSGLSLKGKAECWLGTREDFDEPPIKRAARHYRAELKSALEGGGLPTAAE